MLIVVTNTFSQSLLTISLANGIVSKKLSHSYDSHIVEAMAQGTSYVPNQTIVIDTHNDIIKFAMNGINTKKVDILDYTLYEADVVMLTLDTNITNATLVVISYSSSVFAIVHKTSTTIQYTKYDIIGIDKY
jgi:hypothetical protein